MLYRARIVVESYSNRARIAIVIGPLHVERMAATNRNVDNGPRTLSCSRAVNTACADSAP